VKYKLTVMAAPDVLQIVAPMMVVCVPAATVTRVEADVVTFFAV
jgi:hypothetical protein